MGGEHVGGLGLRDRGVGTVGRGGHRCGDLEAGQVEFTRHILHGGEELGGIAEAVIGVESCRRGHQGIDE